MTRNSTGASHTVSRCRSSTTKRVRSSFIGGPSSRRFLYPASLKPVGWKRRPLKVLRPSGSGGIGRVSRPPAVFRVLDGWERSFTTSLYVDKHLLHGSADVKRKGERKSRWENGLTQDNIKQALMPRCDSTPCRPRRRKEGSFSLTKQGGCRQNRRLATV